MRTQESSIIKETAHDAKLLKPELKESRSKSLNSTKHYSNMRMSRDKDSHNQLDHSVTNMYAESDINTKDTTKDV